MSDAATLVKHLRAWAGPRRWSILVEGVLAAVLVLVTLPFTLGDADRDGLDVVTDYLEAIRDGDVEAAERQIFDGDDYIGVEIDVDRTWLSADVLSSDWTIESVEFLDAYESTVHAVIASGDRTAETKFYLEEDEDGALGITNPYANVSVSSLVADELDLNGHVGSVELDEDLQALQLWLYPGAYTLFDDALDGDGVEFLAMPTDSATDLSTVLGDAFSESEHLEQQLNEDLAAWIDFCVEGVEANPVGCPFNAAGDYTDVDDGVSKFSDVGDLTWAVDTYPRLRLTSGLGLETVEPGWVTLSGNGIDRYEDTEARIEGRCQISISSIDASLRPDGRFEFNVPDRPWNTCHRGLV